MVETSENSIYIQWRINKHSKCVNEKIDIGKKNAIRNSKGIR
jgi:hypothetical protein